MPLKPVLFQHTFHSLRYRNFRLFFSGQGLSLIGTWIQTVAMSWLVYRLTDSALLLGLVGFSSQIPSFLVSPLAGVWIDRWDRRRLLTITQSLSMLQALLMAGLTLTGAITVGHILGLSLFLGVLNAFDVTGRQAFLIEMVEHRASLGNAIALNSLIFNLARLVGPSLAGVLIGLVGEGMCFLINGLSYLAVIYSLLLLRIRPRDRKPRRHVWHELAEGVRYTLRFAPIREVLLLLAGLSIAGTSNVVLMPVFAKQVLGGGPETFGFLMAAIGVGALIATLFMASRKQPPRLGWLLPAASGLFAAGLMALSFTRWLALSLFCLGLAGFGMLVYMTACNTAIQTVVEDDMRGRVMSFYTMALMGTAPLGSLLAGWLASRLGVTATVLLGGVFSLAATLVFMVRLPVLIEIARPIYEQFETSP